MTKKKPKSKFEVIQIIGDDPLKDGGAVAYIDEAGEELFSFWRSPKKAVTADTVYTIYTIPIPYDIRVAYPYLDTRALAAFIGDSKESIEKLIDKSERDLLSKMLVLDMLSEYFGGAALDQEPVDMTFSQLVKKFGAELADPY